MTRGQRSKVVEAHADRILAGRFSVTAFAAHFEAQMGRGRVRRLFDASYLRLARAWSVLSRTRSR